MGLCSWQQGGALATTPDLYPSQEFREGSTIQGGWRSTFGDLRGGFISLPRVAHSDQEPSATED